MGVPLNGMTRDFAVGHQYGGRVCGQLGYLARFLAAKYRVLQGVLVRPATG